MPIKSEFYGMLYIINSLEKKRQLFLFLLALFISRLQFIPNLNKFCSTKSAKSIL